MINHILFQVSILLHPYVVGNGASLDLPIITEDLHEESLAELELDDDDSARFTLSLLPPQEARSMRKAKAHSQENLVDDSAEPFVVLAGPSTSEPLPPSLPDNNEFDNDANGSIPNLALHHSLILAENPAFSASNNTFYPFLRGLQKSYSTQSFQTQINDELTLDTEIKDALKVSISLDSRIGDPGDEFGVQEFYDTNIQHNDRYPEANDVDSLDNEIMDALLSLETGNLPDLTEEQSSSLDESTRRDDVWMETLSLENLNYLNRILSMDQDGTSGQNLEVEWEASGESCEHLHLVLKYWHFLVLPFPELRQAVSWGQVRCYCNNCQPDAQPPLAGKY